MCVALGGRLCPPYPLHVPPRCLLDGRLGRSRFLPQHRDGALRFQLDSFLFPNASSPQVRAGCVGMDGGVPCGAVLAGGCLSPQIFLRCHLRAAVAGAGGSKTCSYDPSAAAWRSPDGADCSCCGSPGGCRGRRRRQDGGTGKSWEYGMVLAP